MKFNKFLRITAMLICIILLFAIPIGCENNSPEQPSSTSEGDGASDVEDLDSEASAFPYYQMADECSAMIEKLSSLINNSIEENTPPFSFDYGGVPSSELLPEWDKNVTTQDTDAGQVITAQYTDPDTGLKVIFSATLYSALPSAEWVVTFENTSQGNSKNISNLNSTDILLPLEGSAVTCNTTKGTNPTGDESDHYDFQPVSTELSSEPASFANEGGRSAECAWPFFDLIGDNAGYVIAVGWTGAWQAQFSLSDGGVKVNAGRQYFDTYLLPNESVRTPSTVITYFEGDAEYGHNLWRHTVTNYYTPEQLTSSWRTMPISIMAWGGESEEMLKKVALSSANLDLGIDTLWIDAGWYADVVPESNGIAAAEDWKYHVGTWTYNKALYPNGNMADLGTTCEENDIDLLQWFELERAYAGSENTLMHPELYYEYTQNNNYLLRLDTQEGYDYMYNYLATQIETNKIDIYRQDFNMQPINYWLSQDDEGRTGITETYYITNLYRLFDELSAAFPDLLIDNCASGGRRLDIEMTKRSVPLFRTDYTTNKNYATSEMLQAQTQSISYWLPLTGTGFGQSNVKTFNDYTMMSHISPAVSLPNSFDNPSLYKSCTSIYRQSQPYWTGDLYNLTDVSYDASSNQAYELFRPDMNSGMAMIYIRPESSERAITITLKGLVKDCTYEVTSPIEGDEVLTMTGEELMTTGLTFESSSSAAYAVFFSAVK